MFDRLIDLLVGCIDLFKFWIILMPYQGGVLVRLGKFVRELEPGLHWLIPFGVDQVLTEHTVPQFISLAESGIISKDGRHIGFHPIVLYKISDIRKALLEVSEVEHAVYDACSGEIGRVLHESTFDEIIGDGILDKLTAACRKRGWRFGIEIMSVQLSGLAVVKNLRIIK